MAASDKAPNLLSTGRCIGPPQTTRRPAGRQDEDLDNASIYGMHPGDEGLGAAEEGALAPPRWFSPCRLGTMDELVVRRGLCHAIYAYEVAHSIDLDAAERRIAASERQRVKHKDRAPTYFEYRPAPLRVTWEAATVEVAGSSTLSTIDLVMYDF